MAGHLKRYGQYFIFAAASITGVFVWQNQSRVPRAEDYAEVFNAAAERDLVPDYNYANWDSASPSNLFPSAVLTTNFVDKMIATTRRAFFSGRSVGAFVKPDEVNTNGQLTLTDTGTSWTWLLATNTLFDSSSSFVSCTNYLRISSNNVAVPGRPEPPDFPLPDINLYPWPLPGWNNHEPTPSARTSLSTKSQGAVASSNYTDGAMCSLSVRQPGSLRFPTGVPGTNQPLVRRVFYNASTNRLGGFSFTLPAEGCAWTTNMGPYAFVSPRQVNPLNRVPFKEDLVSSVRVLEGLNISVAPLNSPNTTGKQTSGYDGVSENSLGDLGDDSSVYLADAAVVDATTNSYSGTSWDYYFYYEYQYLYRYSSFFSPPDDSYRWYEFEKSVKTPTNYTSGQSISYPYAFAVTNGYVARIRVFAIFATRVDVVAEVLFPSAPDGTGFHSATYPVILSDANVSFSVPVSEFNAAGMIKESSMGNMVYPINYGATDEHDVIPKLALLYDKTNPSSTNDLLWSNVTMPEMVIEGTPDLVWTTGCSEWNIDDGDAYVDYETHRRSSYSIRATVTPAKYFVVVDWSWAHLNPNNPYTPPE